MTNRIDAREVAKSLACEGLSAPSIEKELQAREMDGLLDRAEIESIATAARAAGAMIPRGPSTNLSRVIGFLAVLFGLGGILIGGGSIGRYSPASLGLGAIILGLILILKPGWAGESVK